MSSGYLIGIDLGTTLAKGTIYDLEGRSVAEATEEMNTIFPSAGEAEQDPNQFYSATVNIVNKCFDKSRIDKKQIKAIAIDSQMGGIMTIDKNFNPVTYYDTPLDSRSALENSYMHDNFGDLILEKNGSYSTYGNKILYWKKRNEWKDIYKFIQPSAFVAGKLGGLSGKDAYIDETFLCFSGLADLKNSVWSEELCSKLEVDFDKLPKIIKPTQIIGETSKIAFEDCGLPQGIPIAAGCGDQSAGFTGAGIFKNGAMVDVSGTACVLSIKTGDFTYDKKNKTLACMKSAMDDGYFLISVVLGGRTHKWFVDEFCGLEKLEAQKSGIDIYDFMDDKVKNIDPGSDSLIAVDYLQGRFFPPDSNTRGLFIGHTWAHTKEHFYRSVLESIAYDHYLTKNIISELIPNIGFGEVTAIGSGSKSNLWMQIKSDILQLPYRTLFRSDMSTLGSAIIAGFSIGLFKKYEDINQDIFKKRVEIYPEKYADKKYLKFIEIYRDIFKTLKDTYRKINS
jgi:xylulokinase